MSNIIWPDLPNGWELVKLREIVKVKYGEPLPKAQRNGEGKYPVYSSGGVTGTHDQAFIKSPTIVIGRKGSAGSIHLVEEPCWCIDTAFYVDDLSDQVDIYFLAQLLKFVDLSRFSIVVGVPGLNRDDLYNVTIPLPPLAEQQYIIEILQQADELRLLRQDSLAKAKNLASVLFSDMFGNLLVNEKSWKTKKLDKLCDLVRGSSPRPQGDSRYFGGNVPRLMVADLTRDGTYVTPQIDSLTEEGAKQSRPMNAGEVVMAVSGAPGLAAILNVDACIHDGFVGFRNLSDEVLPEFFVGVLGAMKVFNKTQAMGAVFLNLKSEQIRAWIIPIPPKKEQERYVSVFKEIHVRLNEIRKSQEKIEAFASQLSKQAFVGQLTDMWRKNNDHAPPVRVSHHIKHEPAKVVSSYRSEFYRQWMYDQLSIFQQHVLNYFHANSGYLVEDGLDNLIDELPEDINHDQEQKVRKTLEQLVMLGLVMKVSVQGKEGSFVSAYRALRKDDDSRGRDRDKLEVW